MANEKKESGINLPNLTRNEQGIEEIIASKKDASVIHEDEQQSLKEAQTNAEGTRKCFLVTFAEKSRTAETNNEEDATKKKRTRPSGSETINYLHKKAVSDLELKKEKNNIKQMQEERLRVSSENQIQLCGQVIND